MKRGLAFIIAAVLPVLCFGQLWVARYNGTDNSYDKAEDIAVDGSGNVYITGTSTGSGTYSDYVSIKYDPDGDSLWVARYNGTADLYDEAQALAVAGGYVYVTGGSMDANIYNDFMTIKYSDAGDSLWAVLFNGTDGYDDYAYAITADNAGNVYAAGYSTGMSTGWDFVTVKYNSSGTEQWMRDYVTTDQEYATAMVIDNDGNLYVTGSSGDPYYATWDYLTIKYDSAGVEQWVARYNGPANGHDEARAIALDPSGNIVVTGSSAGTGSGLDYTTIKYNPAGETLWVARYNGPGNSADWAHSVAIDNAGNIYVTGGSTGSGNDLDFATVKYNPSGVEQWAERYDGTATSEDEANAIALDPSDNVYVTGYSTGTSTGTDYLTIKYNSSGDSLWTERYNGPANGDDIAHAIAIYGSDYVCITGESAGSGTDRDYATIKYACTGVIENAATVPAVPVSLRIHPNPCTRTTTISYQLPVNTEVTIQIYDVTGTVVKVIRENGQTAGYHAVTLDTDGFLPGVYFARLVTTLTTGGHSENIQKFVLTR